MPKKDHDPMSYIESAFLDAEQEKALIEEEEKELDEIPTLLGSFQKERTSAQDAPQPGVASRSLVDAIRQSQAPADPKEIKLKTTKMQAPRPRRRRTPAGGQVITPETEQLWMQLPKNLKFLARVYDDGITKNYYTGDFKKSREQLIMGLIDPELNLEDTARLLGVCPATVRRYTNRGWLKHHRTQGNQRRFRLSGIVAFVEEYGRNPE